jgi:hypothetical protein
MNFTFSTRAILLAIILAAAMPNVSLAQEPLARASLPDKSDVWVGQHLPLVVELLAPGYFAGAPAFDLPDPKGLLLVPPAGRPVLSSQKIGDTDYTVQRHELSVFARRAGAQTIPAFKVRFSFKRQPLDKDSVSAAVLTTPITFTAKSPPGAENLGSILSARNLTAVETWKPEPGKAKAGDAFTRTITFAAPGMPWMAFPPFPVPQIDGLGFYPKAPEVLDKSDRGEIHGERRDTITCVCQRAGRFVIPAVRLTWFDLDAKQLRTIDFPARTLDVAPNPAMAAAKPPTAVAKPDPGMRELSLQILLPFGVIAGLVYWKGRALREYLTHTFEPVHLAPLNPPDPASRREGQMNPHSGV